MPTLLCVPIMVQDGDSALADAAQAKALGADLVEFRIDEVFHGEHDELGARLALALAAESPLPCVITCRAASEGGYYDGDEPARVSLYERLGTAFGPDERPPRYLDFEYRAYASSANIRQKIRLAVEHPEQSRDLTTSLILSTHDFRARPPDLTRRVVAMKTDPTAKVLKIAFRARSLRDNLELFEILQQRDRPTIALGMGEFGLLSRVLAPKFGGFLTFASLRDSTATAPGQPTIADLLGTYRFRSIGPSTKVYGVVGWPVTHSKSPAVHNAGFSEIGHDGVYLPLPVAAGEDPETSYASFKSTVGELADFSPLTLCGLSVTIPHKENLVRFAVERGWEIDEPSRAVGAANTVQFSRGPAGELRSARAFNTDITAVAACLVAVSAVPISQNTAAVVGAGGVGKAAAYALASRGAAVTIYNRTPERAERLVNDLRPLVPGAVTVGAWDSLARADADIVVNATSVGMSGGPSPDQSPIPVRAITAARADARPAPVAFETVYTPLVTPFLSEARAAGWRVIDGASMFVAQAAAQFSAWTGRPAPIATFDRILRSR